MAIVSALASGALLRGKDPDTYDLKFTLGLSNIDVRQVADRWSGRVEVKAFSRDNSEMAYEAFSEVSGLNLRQESFERALRSGLEYRRTLTLDRNAVTIRLIVRDVNSDGFGTLTIRIPKAVH